VSSKSKFHTYYTVVLSPQQPCRLYAPPVNFESLGGRGVFELQDCPNVTILLQENHPDWPRLVEAVAAFNAVMDAKEVAK
jgi:hypothetical protein